jgi:hypothetical protein
MQRSRSKPRARSQSECRCDVRPGIAGRFLFALCILNCALLDIASAQSKDDPSIGSWTLNVAKSKFTPGPPIKADTRSYEVVDGWLIVTTETTQASGEKTGVRFAAKFDGKDYPQIGRFAPTVSLISYQPVDKRTLKYTVKDTAGTVTSTNTRTVSADGKTMTIEQKTMDANGRPALNVELFERR